MKNVWKNKRVFQSFQFFIFMFSLRIAYHDNWKFKFSIYFIDKESEYYLERINYLCFLTLCCLVSKSYPTLCDPMDCSLPGFSVHGISQARILKWLAISFSRISSPPWDWTCIFRIAGGFFTTELPGKPTLVLEPQKKKKKRKDKKENRKNINGLHHHLLSVEEFGSLSR